MIILVRIFYTNATSITNKFIGIPICKYTSRSFFKNLTLYIKNEIFHGKTASATCQTMPMSWLPKRTVFSLEFRSRTPMYIILDVFAIWLTFVPKLVLKHFLYLLKIYLLTHIFLTFTTLLNAKKFSEFHELKMLNPWTLLNILAQRGKVLKRALKELYICGQHWEATFVVMGSQRKLDECRSRGVEIYYRSSRCTCSAFLEDICHFWMNSTTF